MAARGPGPKDQGRRLPLTNSAPPASVVIVNFNGIRHLPGCLDALSGQVAAAGAEVVVVDNCSSDGSLEWLRDRKDIRLVEAGSNRGFAGGNNLGFESARGRYLVMLNTDTRVRPGWLAALIATADSDSRAAAVTSKLVFAARPAVIQNAGQLLLSDCSGGDRGAGEEDRGQYSNREEVFGFCGAAALIRRDALDDAGDFDERFFMYYEDLDLSWRMRLRGWRILFEPAAVVEHEHAGSSGEWSPFFTFHADRNRLLMTLKNARVGLLAASYRSLLKRASGGTAAGGSGSGRPPSPRGRVLRSFLRHLPGLLLSRLAVRARRRVADAEIERWLYPRERWDARSA